MTCRTALPNPFNTTTAPPPDPLPNRVATRGIGQPLRVVPNEAIDEAKFFRDIGQPGRDKPDFLT